MRPDEIDLAGMAVPRHLRMGHELAIAGDPAVAHRDELDHAVDMPDPLAHRVRRLEGHAVSFRF